MSSYLRPRRGKNATAIAQLGANAPLKRGEVFFEVPDAGVGTGLGKIKMGDGSTAYANLPYFLEQLDLDNAKIAFTDSNTPDDNPYTTNTTLATAIAPTASVKTIFTNLKQLLVNHNAQLTQLNNEIGSPSKYQISGDNAVLYRYGRLRILKLYAYGLSSSGLVQFRLSEEDKPETKVYFTVLMTSSHYFFGFVGIGTDGSLEVRYVNTSSQSGTLSNGKVYGEVVYFTA